MPDGDYTIPLQQANITREGGDVTIVTYSRMANRCLEVAEELADEDIDAEVIDLRCLKPLDMGTILRSVRKTGRVLLVSEGPENNNAVTEIAMRINEHGFDYLDAPMRRVCAADTPIPMSPTLEDACIPNVERIKAGVRDTLA